MKNKAFTLVELIAVIAILALIALVVYPAINSVLKTTREEAYDTQITTVINAAKEWSVDNATILKEDGTQYPVSVKELIDKGYIAQDEVKDPKDRNKDLDGNVIIKYNEKIKSYEYTYEE